MLGGGDWITSLTCHTAFPKHTAPQSRMGPELAVAVGVDRENCTRPDGEGGDVVVGATISVGWV